MMTRITYATGAKDDPASPTFRYLGPARLLATFDIFMIHVSITFPSTYSQLIVSLLFALKFPSSLIPWRLYLSYHLASVTFLR